MKLPVIQTCRECGYCFRTHDPGHVGDICAHPSADAQEMVGSSEPPDWCPLRTGPDAERVEALEAVVSAAARVDSLAYRANLTGDDWMTLTRALRRLT